MASYSRVPLSAKTKTFAFRYAVSYHPRQYKSRRPFSINMIGIIHKALMRCSNFTAYNGIQWIPHDLHSRPFHHQTNVPTDYIRMYRRYNNANSVCDTTRIGILGQMTHHHRPPCDKVPLCNFSVHENFQRDSRKAPSIPVRSRKLSDPTSASSCGKEIMPAHAEVNNHFTRKDGESGNWKAGSRSSNSSTLKVCLNAGNGRNGVGRTSTQEKVVSTHREGPDLRENGISDFSNLSFKDFSLSSDTMSLNLLLDPIIGSPPSSLTSPMTEARDDISALSEGFTRKVKVLRRRLSTSFDEPSSPDPSSSKAFGGSSVDHVGPFTSRRGRGGSGSKIEGPSTAELGDHDSIEKKVRLNTWLEKLYEDAVAKGNGGTSSASSHESSPGPEGEEGPHNQGGSGGSRDSSNPSSRSSSLKIPEDLFQLLEKVIGFKGRNISHITVEQSVKDLCTVYMDASDGDKLKFFTVLAEQYSVDHDNVTSIAASLASCQDSDVKLTLEDKLRGALVPKSQWLFTQIGRLENGVKFLVDLRTDLLDAIEKSQGNSSLKALNNSLRDLIGMWFNVGFLNLERVTWQSSCDMLQKISEYEAVHPMRNWTDLKKRVGPNRRCFVFTHNSMPSEPVVVLHTYLTDHIPSSIQKIVASHKIRMMSLDSESLMVSASEDPDCINTAAFYSITSTQRGLTGIELGNYLIKRVVRELQSEFPKMTQYSSLSPIPGFKNWLVGSLKTAARDSGKFKLLTDHEIEILKPVFQDYDANKDLYEVFLDLLKVNSWFSEDKFVKAFEKPLMRLCAHYLYVVKRRGYALDPVAHFHLKNGAVLWRINWRADTSPRGLGQSCGMMVNYRYFLDACESNSQNYMENQVIQVSDQVNHIVKLTES